MGVCYRPPEQKEELDEAFYWQPLQGSWNNPMGTGPAGKRDPRELVDTQRSLPSGSKMM